MYWHHHLASIYIIASFGKSSSFCLDVDECLSSPCDNTTINCTNFPGDYECTCDGGFVSDIMKRKCFGMYETDYILLVDECPCTFLCTILEMKHCALNDL